MVTDGFANVAISIQNSSSFDEIASTALMSIVYVPSVDNVIYDISRIMVNFFGRHDL